MFKRYAIVSDGDIRSAISRLEESRLEQTKAENSHDFSHDSTDPSETSENGKRAKVN
jgi:hypothetical protein